VDKTLLQPSVTKNKAGGAAFSLSSRESLAQYAATGFFGSTYYTTAAEQLEEVGKLCLGVDDAFIAKAAIYARQQGRLKDMPAYLLATLAARKSKHLSAAFTQVVDNGRMLRNFVQIVRSGVTGRKSFGSRPRLLIENYLNARAPMALLRDSIGEEPSLSYIIRTIRPNTMSAGRRALFGYLIGDEYKVCKPRGKDGQVDKAMLAGIVARQELHKLAYELDQEAGTIRTRKYDAEALPDQIKQFEAWKRDRTGTVPDVDFRLLDALSLTNDEWAEVASRANWLTTLKNLNTFKRHGVLDKEAMVSVIAERLVDVDQIRRAKVFPYQILQAYKAVSEEPANSWTFTPPNGGASMPAPIVQALHDAMEHALENVPYLDANVAICLDVSGSMNSPITGVRKGATTKVRYVDAAALFAAAFSKRSKKSIVLPFDTRCFVADLDKTATTMNFASRLASLGGGGTMCELPMAELNKRGLSPDIVIYVSDNESWAGGYYQNTTGMMNEWKKLKARVPKAKLVCIDIAAATSTQTPSSVDRLNVGGFSDSVFTVVSDFLTGDKTNWVGHIEAVKL
jgi:60 kDa SS-A/Ro ribonucleoprotein